MNSRPAIRTAACLALGLVTGAAISHAGPLAAAPAAPGAGDPPAIAGRDVPHESPLRKLVSVDQRAFGRSGTLKVAVVRALESVDLPFVRVADDVDGVTYQWVPLHGTRPERVGGQARLAQGLRAPGQQGIWRLVLQRDGERHEVEELAVVTKVPFSEKRGGRLNGYVIGTYATERSSRTDRYAPPAGFIEVTPENRDMHISRHLRLGQFLTKDQFNVWPKYVALDLMLIDKLELVMQELRSMGVRAERLHIMSGFRTPNYNGPGEGGRALLSRHTYGDAADVWVENGALTGYMADLNGDGRHDTRDAELLQEAVERVEQRYPELTGGSGVYRENGSRGPYVHIDVRGHRSRW